jgi:site-specific recombinase XerC
MSKVRIPYIKRYYDKRLGRTVVYFRKHGCKPVALPQPIGCEEFWITYKAALGDKIEIGAEKRSIAGSVSAAIAAYYTSTQWTDDLSDGTRGMRRPILEGFRKKYGEGPLRRLSESFLTAYLETLRPHAARNHLKALRGWLKHAKHNAAAGIKARKAKTVKHPSWTPEAMAQYEAHHAIGTKARLAFALARYTGAGRNEIACMGPQHIATTDTTVGEEITITRRKTGVEAVLKVHPALRAIIDATPLTGMSTFLVTKSGKPYAPNDLSEQFREWCDEAGVPEKYSLHGLRHAMGDKIAEEGGSTHEVACALGQKDLRSAARYTEGVNRKKLSRKAMTRVIESTDQARSGNPNVSVSNPPQTLFDEKARSIK